MNAQRGRCVDELADAGVHALLYACLVAVMAQGAGSSTVGLSTAVAEQLAERGLATELVSSAGALVDALAAMSWAAGSRWSCRTCARWPSRSSPIPRPRGSRSSTGWRSRSGDNAEVGCIPGDRVLDARPRARPRPAPTRWSSPCCVQMPSLPLVAVAERRARPAGALGRHGRGVLPAPGARAADGDPRRRVAARGPQPDGRLIRRC